MSARIIPSVHPERDRCGNERVKMHDVKCTRC